MSAETSDLSLRLDPDGVLRVVAMPVPRLAITKVAADPPYTGLTRAITLEGTSFGMPPGTQCRVTCTAEGREPVDLSGGAALELQGSWAPETEQPCTLRVRLSILEARLFGRGSFTLTFTPSFPRARPATTPMTFRYDHALEVVASATGGALAIGDAVTFQTTAAAHFAGCRLEVLVSESDAGKGETSRSEGDLAVTLAWGAAGQPALGKPQRWQVGCDAAGHLDYAETNELGDFEFVHEVRASADGERWVPVKERAPLCKTARPSLRAFALERRDAAVWAVGALDGVSKELAAPVGITAWAHRPATWADAGDLRVMAPLQPRVEAHLEGGRFEALLFDLDHLPAAEVAARSLPARLFAVLELKAGHAAAPLQAALTYDPAVFRPFGAGDLPRTTGKQAKESVATAVCSSGTTADPSVVGVSMVLAPHVGEVGAPAVEGWDLVVRARLLGGDDDYWGKAAPKVEWQVGEEPAVLVTTSARVGQEVVARLPLYGGWGGHGKSVRFRARATKEARLAGALLDPPAGAWSAAYACLPWLSPLEATRGPAGELLVTGGSRYVPTGGAKFALEATLEAGAPAAPVALRGASTTCGADGRFAFTLTPKSGAGALPAGALRVAAPKKVGGLDVPVVTKVV